MCALSLLQDLELPFLCRNLLSEMRKGEKSEFAHSVCQRLNVNWG